MVDTKIELSWFTVAVIHAPIANKLHKVHENIKKNINSFTLLGSTNSRMEKYKHNKYIDFNNCLKDEFWSIDVKIARATTITHSKNKKSNTDQKSLSNNLFNLNIAANAIGKKIKSDKIKLEKNPSNLNKSINGINIKYNFSKFKLIIIDFAF